MLFPTAYFPSIYYIQEVAKFKQIELEQLETFPKQTLRNRCYILSSNGPLCLSVPIKHNKQKIETTQEIQIDHTKNWQQNHLRAIQSAYASAPFFEDYFFEIEHLILKSSTLSLLELNVIILKKLLDCIDLSIDITFNKHFTKLAETRDRDYFKEQQNSTKYYQVFIHKFGFHSNPSFIDLLMNEGPMARKFILNN